MARFQERIKFYADTPRHEKNKFFCFECSMLHCKEFLYKFFFNGFSIRAAYYEKTEIETGKILENLKFNIPDLKEKYLDETEIIYVNGTAQLKIKF